MQMVYGRIIFVLVLILWRGTYYTPSAACEVSLRAISAMGRRPAGPGWGDGGQRKHASPGAISIYYAVVYFYAFSLIFCVDT